VIKRFLVVSVLANGEVQNVAHDLAAVVVGIRSVGKIVVLADGSEAEEPGVPTGVLDAALAAAGQLFVVRDEPGDAVEIFLRFDESGASKRERTVVAGEPLGNPERRSVDHLRIVEGAKRARPKALDVPGMEKFVG